MQENIDIPQDIPPQEPQQHTEPDVLTPSTVTRIHVPNLGGVTNIEEHLNTKDKNWPSWSQSMHLLLNIINATPYIEGKTRRPNPIIDAIGTENWCFNDSYTKMLIAKNLAPSEKVHTQGCKTTHDMWKNLHKVHQSTSYQIHIDKLHVLYSIKVKEGDNIPEYLIQLKNHWDQITFFTNEDNCHLYNNRCFKQHIAVSLP